MKTLLLKLILISGIIIGISENGYSQKMINFCYDASGDYILFQENTYNYLNLIEVKTGFIIHNFGINALWFTYSPDYKSIVVSYGNQKDSLIFYDANTYRVTKRLPGRYCPFFFTPDGKSIISINKYNQPCIDDLITGEQKIYDPKISKSYASDGVDLIDMSPDGKLLFVHTRDYPDGVILDVASKKVLKKFPMTVMGTYFKVEQANFSKDGKYLMALLSFNNKVFFSVPSFKKVEANISYNPESENYFSINAAKGEITIPKKTGKQDGTITISPLTVNQYFFDENGKSTQNSNCAFKITQYEVLNRYYHVLSTSGGFYQKFKCPNKFLELSKQSKYAPLLLTDSTEDVLSKVYSDEQIENFFISSLYYTKRAGLSELPIKLILTKRYNEFAINRLVEKAKKTYASIENADFSFWISRPKQLVELESYGHTAEIMDIAFTSDGKKLISVARDKTIRVWDVESGENIKTLRGYISEGEIGSYYRLAITPDDKMVAVGGYLDGSSGSNIGDIRFFDIETGEIKGVIEKAKHSVSAMTFSADGSRFAFGSTDKMVRTMKREHVDGTLAGKDYTGQRTSAAITFGEPILAVALSPDGKKMVFTIEKYKFPILNYIDEFESDGRPKMKELQNHHEREVVAAAFTPDGKYIITADSYSAVLWDSDGNFVRDFAKVYLGARDGDIAFSKDGSKVIIGTAVFDFATGNQISKFSDWGVKVSAYSPAGIVANGQSHEIQLWDPATGKLIKTLGPKFNKVNGIGFVGNGLKLAISKQFGMDKSYLPVPIPANELITIFDFETLKIIENNNASAQNNLKFQKGDIKLSRPVMTADGKEDLATILFGSTKINANGQLGMTSVFTLLPSGEALIGTENNLRIYNSSGTIRQELLGHSSAVRSVAISPDGKYLASFGDNKICLWNLTDQSSKVNPLATLYLFSDGEWICTSKYNYYSSSKRGGKYFGFHINQGLGSKALFYPFDQFDLQLNRPDLVLSLIGINNPELEKSYHAAYLKRLAKQGLNEFTVGKEILPPTLKLHTLARTTTSPNDFIELTASDRFANLSRVMLRINDIPIFGTEGYPLKGEKGKEVTQKIPITLSQGKNKIQVSVINEEGVESLSEQVIIVNNAPASKPNLYVLAVGVSDYKDNDYDLRYATKDANDLTAALQTKMPSLFNQVKVMKIVNQQATRENILKAKDFLMQSNVNDKVIVFFAGHGLLNDKLNWYFGTYDLDFANPSTRGLLYEEIEGLLSGIPARNRLIMMDACHSGEVDKVESSLVASTATNTSANVKSRGFKSKMVVQNSIGLKNSFEMMQQLFADLSNGSGAMVISSAGGAEYAFESPQWNNGVFTYSVLEGLKTGNADKNKDKTITVTELRDYVIAKVQALTNGKQTPTSRKENIEFDFKVW